MSFSLQRFVPFFAAFFFLKEENNSHFSLPSQLYPTKMQGKGAGQGCPGATLPPISMQRVISTVKKHILLL